MRDESSSKLPKIGGEYGDIREGARLNISALTSYVEQYAPSIQTPLNVKQFKFGQSNPTYFLTDSNAVKFVLRKKPAGTLLSPTAHAVEREYKVLKAIHDHNKRSTTHPDARVPVPEPIVLCEDTSVLGTPFYIMEFLDGRIFTDVRMPEVSMNDKRELWLAAIRALGALSSLDPDELGLSTLAARTPYFPRQVKSMGAVQVAQSKAVDPDTQKPVGSIPGSDSMILYYRSNFPDESRTGSRIVHGDYKIDNIIFHPTEARVIGILDWELCTLGSPLADLANVTMPFNICSAQQAKSPLLHGFKDLPREMVPISLEELHKEYCRLTGWSYPLHEMTYVSSWMMYRLAIISQGIAARYVRKQASSANAAIQLDLFPVFAEIAQDILGDAYTTFIANKVPQSRM